jgi:hypothetical protein
MAETKPEPCIHAIHMATKHGIPYENMNFIGLEEFEKMFQEKTFTDGPSQEIPRIDSRVPYSFTTGYKYQAFGVVNDILFYAEFG